MSDRYQMVCIDLDRTLLDGEGCVPEPNRRALHLLHERGLKIVLTTGRSFTETRPVLDEIGLDLDAAVTVGGALLADARSGATIEKFPMHAGQWQPALAWMRDRGYAVLWLHDAAEAGFDGYVFDGPRRHPAVDRWIEKSPCVVREVDAPPPDAPPPLRLTIVDDSDALHAIEPEFARRFDGLLTHNIIEVPTLHFTVLETFAVPVDKWFGIRRLCERWRMDPRRTIAIGDDVNDVPMLRHAGLGIAVANAPADVRRVADRITARHDEAGVARALAELFDLDPREVGLC